MICRRRSRCIRTADLEFPLRSHHFRVRAGNCKSCIKECQSVRFDKFCAKYLVASNDAVVPSLGSRISTALRPTQRPYPIFVVQCVFLLKTKPWLTLFLIFFQRFSQNCTRIAFMGSSIRMVYFAQYQYIWSSPDRIGYGASRNQIKVACIGVCLGGVCLGSGIRNTR